MPIYSFSYAKKSNIGTILSRYTCAMHRQGLIPLNMLVHLSSHPSYGNTYHTFIDIILVCIVVDTSEYENYLSFRHHDLYYL